ncbi:MAG: carbohydrate kinase family protein [Verrucomicrobiales bacterium]|nr:carbohydrate kinase family protein [Verrucomicrobiales bacterium]
MPDPSPAPSRHGLLAAGNFIVDHVKLIDAWPAEEMLATIHSEQTSNGGGAYNLLIDLAKLGAPFPLEAAGLLGTDPAADWILEDCRQHNIDIRQLRPRQGLSTSYTDAFTAIKTGRRTFFHHRGANAAFSPEDIDLSASQARLFYLGYLMLLDTMDATGPDARSAASHLLEKAVLTGFTTVVDMVSVAHPDLIAGTLTALPWIDHFILNELEAGQITDRQLRRGDGSPDLDAMESAARALLAAGVRKSVTIHAVEGAVTADAAGCVRQSSLNLPAGYIKGATGAGDAFAAGFVFGLHENLPAAECLRIGVCAAAACLADPTPSQGLRPVGECLELGGTHGYRQP